MVSWSRAALVLSWPLVVSIANDAASGAGQRVGQWRVALRVGGGEQAIGNAGVGSRVLFDRQCCGHAVGELWPLVHVGHVDGDVDGGVFHRWIRLGVSCVVLAVGDGHSYGVGRCGLIVQVAFQSLSVRWNRFRNLLPPGHQGSTLGCRRRRPLRTPASPTGWPAAVFSATSRVRLLWPCGYFLFERGRLGCVVSYCDCHRHGWRPGLRRWP